MAEAYLGGKAPMELDLIPVVSFMEEEADKEEAERGEGGGEERGEERVREEGRGAMREFLRELHGAMRARADPLEAAAERRKPDKYLAFRKVRTGGR